MCLMLHLWHNVWAQEVEPVLAAIFAGCSTEQLQVLQ